MARRKRKKGQSPPTETKADPAIVPWRQRARDTVRRLREFARERAGQEIEIYLRRRFGDEASATSVAELERAFDDYVCHPGTPEDGRSLLRVFAEETEDLGPEERESLPTWETERRRGVYLLDRAHRDQLHLWDPLGACRVVVQLLERLPRGQVAMYGRGTVILAVTAPLGQRIVALGQVEMYTGDEAIQVFRKEVRDQGRVWHDLPKPAPTT